MAPMKWLDDGWFTINDGKDITFDMPGLYNLSVPKVWRDDFKGEWVYVCDWIETKVVS